MAATLSASQASLITHAMSVGALKFGSFTLKSGRQSPYFFNSSLLSSGSTLSVLATALADTLADVGDFDILFGPAYKGIPLGAITVVKLFEKYGRDVGMAYDRKEAKDHGEGGMLVGVPMAGMKVVIVDDVMTSGKAIRGAIDAVRSAGGEVVGVVQCLDREEVGRDEGTSTVREVEEVVGRGKVRAILKMRDLMRWLENEGKTQELDDMKGYWERYGIKD
ncbi:orotate phosphoribosyltransferase [Armillaria nabsnona]|nr:orotate phosphoribosyltransferase [Armillaria nabsnona]